MKIALSVPHTPNRPGASACGVNEYGLGCAVIGDLIYRLTKTGHEAWLIGADNNLEQINQINKLNVDCGLELHFNAFTKDSMKGTEVLHANSEKGILLADCIQKSLVKRLGTRDRGIMIGHFRGNVRKPILGMLQNTNCPFVIPEPLFLSNPGDFSKIDVLAISWAIFTGLENYEQILKGEL